MTLPVWPSTVPHVSAQPPNALDQPYAQPVVTEVEDGPELMRPQSQTAIERYAYMLKMTHAQFAAFKSFALTTLGQCTSHFTMMVNVLGLGCVERRAYIEGGQYRAEPRGSAVFVNFRLCVFPGAAVPVVLSNPVISGNKQVGQYLSCTDGTWLNAPTGHAYQWHRNGVAMVPLQDNNIYFVVAPADIGAAITCKVVATNALGSSLPAGSNTLIIDNVAANTVAPSIGVGIATVGDTLVTTDGTWTYSPTSYAYQWRRNGVNISGETLYYHYAVAADVGTAITCAVTATNPQGVSSPAISNARTVVAAGAGIVAGTGTAAGVGVAHGFRVITVARAGTAAGVGTGAAVSGGVVVLDTPSLDLQAASDTGSSSTDNITSDTTPSMTATFPSGLLAGDHIIVRDNLVEVDDHTVTAGEAGGDPINLGLSALSDGSHSITVRQERGASVSDWSAALVVTIDTAAPTVSGAPAITSTPAVSDTYATAENITFAITFSHAVTVTGVPQLTITVGASSKIAAYASGSGTTALVFSYTVASGDTDANGVSVAANSLAQAGGSTIKDVAGNNATLTHSALTDQMGHKVSAAGASAEVSQYLARATGMDATHIAAFTALINGIVADGEWAGLDGLWIGATDTFAHSLLNLKENTGDYDLVPIESGGGDVTFTADEGWMTNGITNGVLNTGYAIGDGNAVQNSTAFGFYNRNSNTADNSECSMGIAGGGSFMFIIHNQGGVTYVDVNDAGFPSVSAINQQGMFVASRVAASGAGAVAAYRNSNGTAFLTSTGASASPPAWPVYILGGNFDGTNPSRQTTNEVAAAFIGSGLSSAAAVRISNRINTYMTAIGVNVY